jgi:hypothetical protein
MIDQWLERILKEAVMNYSRCYPENFLGGKKIFSKDSRYPDQDSNTIPPEYESKALLGDIRLQM